MASGGVEEEGVPSLWRAEAPLLEAGMTKNSRSEVSTVDQSGLLAAAAVEAGRGREDMVEIEKGTETLTGSEEGGGCGREYVGAEPCERAVISAIAGADTEVLAFMARARCRSCKYRISAPPLLPPARVVPDGCCRSFLVRVASRTDRPRANIGAAVAAPAAVAVFVAVLEVEDCWGGVCLCRDSGSGTTGGKGFLNLD